MGTSKLTVIDMSIIIIYLVGMMWFGLKVSKSIKTDRDYFLGGKKLPWWAIGMSMVVSDIGALDIVGVAGTAYLYGIAMANFEWIGCIPAMIIGAFIFIPFYWRTGVFTIPEFLGRRYNQFVRTTVALIVGIFMAFLLGVFLYTAAKAINILIGWPEYASILIVAFVVGVYTLFGGLTAVVYTDVAQCVIMFGGSAIILIVALLKIGGWGELVSAVSSMGDQYAHHFELMVPIDSSTPYGWAGILFGLSFVLSPAYWLGNQAIVQRTLGARSEYEAKKSVLWGAFLKLFIPIILVGPGLAGIVLHPGLEKGDDIYPTLIHDLLPPGLTGLVFAAFLAALMSSVDSYLNSAATLWTKDIYQALFRPDKSDRHYMLVGKTFIAIFLVMGVLLAPVAGRFPTIYGYFQTVFSIFQGPLLAIISLGLLWPRANGPGASAGLILGVMTSSTLFWIKDQIFTAPEPFLYIAWWAFCAALLITIVVSLATKPDIEKSKRVINFRDASWEGENSQ
ncbi:MAG: sodium/solute symporter [Candidatus Latescibacteria bacterium]|nr:sodium/solute symporter [Candidatus Latescibacterota bacterium]